MTEQMIKIDRISVGANVRTTFDPAQLEELAASIRTKGIIQPLVLRPRPESANGKTFELVCGARRLRAAESLGMDRVPATVRELDDEAMREVQLIENLQRVDLHPLEEADAYATLAQSASVAQIAAKVGKSPSYITQRLILTKLNAKARKAFADGAFPVGVAFLVARINPELQEAALQDLHRRSWHGDGKDITVNDARGALEHFLLPLAKSPFPANDETLLPAAGACKACPKRTGNARDLFGDVKSAEVCTDGVCYALKLNAWKARQLEHAKESGKEVITGAAAKKVMTYDSPQFGSGMLRVDGSQWIGAKEVSVRSMMAKDDKTVLVEDGRGVLVECVRVKESPTLAAALKKTNSNTYSEAERAAERKRRLEQAVRKATFEAIIAAQDSGVPLPSETQERFILLRMFERAGSDALRLIRAYWDPENKKAGSQYEWGKEYEAKIAQLDDPPEVRRKLLQLAIVSELYVPNYTKIEGSARLIEVAELLHVDHAAIRTKLSAEAKAKAKAAEKAKPLASAKAKPPKKAAPKPKPDVKAYVNAVVENAKAEAARAQSPSAELPSERAMREATSKKPRKSGPKASAAASLPKA